MSKFSEGKKAPGMGAFILEGLGSTGILEGVKAKGWLVVIVYWCNNKYKYVKGCVEHLITYLSNFLAKYVINYLSLLLKNL